MALTPRNLGDPEKIQAFTARAETTMALTLVLIVGLAAGASVLIGGAVLVPLVYVGLGAMMGLFPRRRQHGPWRAAAFYVWCGLMWRFHISWLVTGVVGLASIFMVRSLGLDAGWTLCTAVVAWAMLCWGAWHMFTWDTVWRNSVVRARLPAPIGAPSRCGAIPAVFMFLCSLGATALMCLGVLGSLFFL